MRRIFFHHTAQTRDLHVDRTLHRGVFTTTRQIHQLVTGERLTRVADQRFQHRELTAGERHWLIFTEHFTGAEVQLELTECNDGLFLRRRARQFVRLTTQHGANTRQQFTRVKRLWNVVISANLKADNTVNFFTLRRHHDDRHRVALAAQTATNREPVFARQHQVQHHQVEGFTRQQTIHLFRVRDATNLEALLGQITFQQRTQAHVVIYDQNFVVLLHCVYSQRFG